MKILGIESSCDETAASILDFSPQDESDVAILSNIVYSQTQEHLKYGGVVPEIASRAHMDKIDSVVGEALTQSGVDLAQIDGISVTSGPGLLGGLLVGLNYAKSLSQSIGKPLLGVNHLEGHALTAHLTEKLSFPYTLLLISGGHCQFISVSDFGCYETLGGTIDDSIGECFDKVAKMLGLPYPGGPEIEKLASKGDNKAYTFPKPLKNRDNVDFSFSGLKTALRTHIEKTVAEHEYRSISELPESMQADICASFQESIAQVLENKAHKALKITGHKNFVLAGGVAANKMLRGRLECVCTGLNVEFHAPPVELCTDNAVMIAYAGGLRILRGESSPLDISPKPRWPLSDMTN